MGGWVQLRWLCVVLSAFFRLVETQRKPPSLGYVHLRRQRQPSDRGVVNRAKVLQGHGGMLGAEGADYLAVPSNSSRFINHMSHDPWDQHNYSILFCQAIVFKIEGPF